MGKNKDKKRKVVKPGAIERAAKATAADIASETKAIDVSVPYKYLNRVNMLVADLGKQDAKAKPIKWPKDMYDTAAVEAMTADFVGAGVHVRKMAKQYLKLRDLQDSGVALSVDDADALEKKLQEFRALSEALDDLSGTFNY